MAPSTSSQEQQQKQGQEKYDPVLLVLGGVDKELEPFWRSLSDDIGLKVDQVQWPVAQRNKDTEKGDVFLQMGAVCGRARKNPKEFVPQVAAALNAWIEKQNTGAAAAADGKAEEETVSLTYVKRAEAAHTFLNVFVHRAPVFQSVVNHVLSAGSDWGSCNTGEGKVVLVEHTSSNPNAPLHIGNLRNSIIGATLSKIMARCGYNVKQHFYVNDLGAQIGMTALGFIRVYDALRPKLKIDQWIGIIYAIMNTLAELQKNGAVVPDGYAVLVPTETGQDGFASGLDAAAAVLAKTGTEGGDADALTEYWDILWDLRTRQPELCDLLVKEVGSLNIKEESGKLNLAYEQNKPEAVRVFRKMVIANLGGVQQTLDKYGVKHAAFDFESELGWEGSNDKVLEIMKSSPYFTPQTQKNDKGVPQGAFLRLAEFIEDKGLKTGKGGYMKDYPPMYVLRPDGSTLYTFRDVVYSLKKEKAADFVLNVICAEQNLAQEKVALSLELLHPQQDRQQYHMTYEVVKLLRNGKEVKMSGRRGRYVLADDLYDELREAIRAATAKRESEAESDSAEWKEQVETTLSAAAMKYALLSCNPRTKINFDVAKAANPEESSAPFLLYNGTRFYSLFRKHAAGVDAKKWPAQGPREDAKWATLEEDNGAWALLWNHVVPLPSVVAAVGTAEFPQPPNLPEFPINSIIEHCEALVREFSRYWSAQKILVEGTAAGSAEADTLDARLWLLRALHATLNSGLDMLTIEPLERM